MRKLLLIAAMLFLATPVFAADVTITAKWGMPDMNGPNLLIPVTVGYTGAAEANSIRSFALVLTVDSGMNLDNIRDFNRGESTRLGGGYGIFPGKVRTIVNPTTPDACFARPDYNPLAPETDPNAAGSGNDRPRMVVELGTLYKDANVPGASGTLFSVDINMEGLSECNVCIAVDQTRGGVVKKDSNSATVTLLPGGFGAPPGCIYLNLCDWYCGCFVPDLNGMDRVAARAAIIAAKFTVGNEANVAPTSAGQAVGTVIAQKPAAHLDIQCRSPIDINVVSYPIKQATAAASLYVNWVNRGRPACWAYPRQCRGDADGKKFGVQWCSTNDLAILRGCITKLESQIPPGGICQDFDHKKFGVQWCSTNDLAILRLCITKLESLVPMCGNVPNSQAGFSTDPNYWYWCNPTGVACPAGQYCAPSGICPNTP